MGGGRPVPPTYLPCMSEPPVFTAVSPIMLLHRCLYVIAPSRETRLGRGGATMTPLSPPPPPVSVRQIYHSPYTLARTLLHALAWTACRAAGPIHHGTLPRVCAQQRGALPPVPGALRMPSIEKK